MEDRQNPEVIRLRTYVRSVHAGRFKKTEKISLRNSTADFLIFSKENGGDGIEVRIEDETIWFTQKLMAELFDTTKQNISLHLKKIFNEGELKESSVVKDYLTTVAED